jgi:hypothetical protein
MLLGIACLFVMIYFISVKLPPQIQQYPFIKEFKRLFDLNGEINIPTWYTGFLWQLAAICCYQLSKIDRRYTGRFPNAYFWIAIGLISLFLSLDEVAQIHEGIGGIADAHGMRLPVYNWIPFGLGFFALVGACLIRFVLGLPRQTCLTILTSGMVFITGAVGFESLGSLVSLGTLHDFPLGLSWHKEIAIEEFLEMAGVILLVAALHLHLRFITEAPNAKQPQHLYRGRS